MYASREDMISRFTERQIRQLESMHVDGELATNKALSDASELMNSYLSTRYITPIVGSEYLTITCCNIARFYLYMQNAGDEVRNRYDEAMKWLKDVQAGKANITYATPLTAEQEASKKVKAVSPVGTSHKGRVFGDDVFAKLPRP